MQIERRYKVGFESEWDLAAFFDAVKRATCVALVAHTNADGDAVGSLCGMAAILSANTTARIIPMLPDGVPDDLAWLPGSSLILNGHTDNSQCLQAIGEADVVIGLDISGWSRTGSLEQPLRHTRARKLLIDHHENPESDAFDVVISEPEASSTCELVYWVMREYAGPDAIGTDAATALFTGICTDTGTFSYSNDRQSVYLATADLLAHGIDPMHINRMIKNVFTTVRMQFFGFAIAHRLKVYEQRKVALMVLTADDMNQAGVSSHELTGLINEVMRLRNIDCAILVREEEGHVRLSLRSKELYDVNRLAADLFGGGGHRRAAGATSTLSLPDTVKKIKQTLALED